MLALIYLALTAKPISLRRLIALFAAVLVCTDFILVLAHATHAPQLALRSASSITFLVWSAPLARAVFDTTRFRKLQLDALQPASGFIRWTYGFALAFVPILTIGIVIHPGHEVPLGGLARLAVAAIFVGTLLQMIFDWKGRYGSGNQRTR